MATDPIRSIRRHEHPTTFDFDLRDALRRLAALPPSAEVPYLTLSLDWRPEGSKPGKRPAREQFAREAAQVVARFWPRGAAFDSVSADIERIQTSLDEELDPEAQGVFVVACHAQGVFDLLPLGIPVRTRLSVAATSALSVLARLEEDYPSYAVLLADQHEAVLTVFTQSAMNQSVSLRSSEYPRKQQAGGWSQRRFQARADERVAAFAKGIAAETRAFLEATGVTTMLILAGDEIMTSALDAELHQTVKDRIIRTLRLDMDASPDALVAATLPLVEQRERDREAERVDDLRDQLGAGGLAVAGIEAVLTSLHYGQVMTVVLNDDFRMSGWADYAMHVYGVEAPPGSHPLGEDVSAVIPISLEEEVVRLAVQHGAAIDFVHTSVPVTEQPGGDIPRAGQPQPRSAPAAALDALGGIGALLRFAPAPSREAPPAGA